MRACVRGDDFASSKSFPCAVPSFDRPEPLPCLTVEAREGNIDVHKLPACYAGRGPMLGLFRLAMVRWGSYVVGVLYEPGMGSSGGHIYTRGWQLRTEKILARLTVATMARSC